MDKADIRLVPLQPEDREQFILDNQWAFTIEHISGKAVREK